MLAFFLFVKKTYHSNIDRNFIENITLGRMSILCVCVLSHFSHVQLYMTLWTVAHQATLSVRFSR